MKPEEAITELHNFIQEDAGAIKEPAAIRNWFLLIRQAVFSANGKPIEPEEAFYELTKGMAARFYEDGITSPKLLEAIRKYAAEFIRASKDEGEVEAPPALYQPIKARNMVMTNTKLSNMLSDLINEGEQKIETGRLKSSNPITETVNITMAPRESEGVVIEGEYTLFHEAVFYAFLSVWNAGNKTVTPHQVYRFLTQNYKSDHLSPASINEVTEAIEDLRRIHVKVDISDEINRRKIKTSGTPYLGEFMLVLYDLEVPIGGEIVSGYGVAHPPLLYEHALMLNQLQSFPARLLAITDPQTGERLRSTANRTTIQIYLLKQISNIESDLKRAKKAYSANEARRAKNPDRVTEKPLSYFRKMNGKILYSTIFEKTGLAGKPNKTLIDYKSYIKICLDNWHDAGKIKGFTPLYEGRRKDEETGVQIFMEGVNKY